MNIRPIRIFSPGIWIVKLKEGIGRSKRDEQSQKSKLLRYGDLRSNLGFCVFQSKFHQGLPVVFHIVCITIASYALWVTSLVNLTWFEWVLILRVKLSLREAEVKGVRRGTGLGYHAGAEGKNSLKKGNKRYSKISQISTWKFIILSQLALFQCFIKLFVLLKYCFIYVY